MGEAQPTSHELQRLSEHELKWSRAHHLLMLCVGLSVTGAAGAFGDFLAEASLFEADLGFFQF